LRRRLFLERASDDGEVVIAVPDGMIFEHELARQRPVGIERDRRGQGEVLIGVSRLALVSRI
jgi:hypothetical protein